jgi:Phosphotransferase enzyme family
MTFIEQQLIEQNEYRVVLVLPRSLKILVERHGNRLRLPRVRVPKWARRAEQLTEALQTKWNVKSIAIDFLAGEQLGPPCCVIEVRTHDWEATVDGLVPFEVDDLDDDELTAVDRVTVHGILAGNAADRGTFSRLGWIDDARTWIQESLPDRLIEFSEDVCVLNAGGPFALVRLGTLHPPAYWLKATGSPNTHEFVVTTTLARLLPNSLPPLVAARGAWNAWVMEDIGRPLHETLSLHSFELALHCLAGLQKASAEHVETLVAAGCFDQRIPHLRAHLPELMRYLEEIMAKQTSTKVLPIESKRLGVLKLLLEDAYIRMEAIGIPNTLLHNDMNTGNILVNGTRAVFTDWAEACVGNPFVTFQHLRIQAEREDATHTWSLSLTALYKQHWRTLLGESQIEEAFALVPPLAIASYLCGRDMSFSASYRNDTRAHSYARSLARHMDRAAQSPEFLEAVCH